MGNPMARYSQEFMIEAVRMVRGGQSMAAVAKLLGISAKTLHNWVKADAAGKLNGAGKQVSRTCSRTTACAAQLDEPQGKLLGHSVHNALRTSDRSDPCWDWPNCLGVDLSIGFRRSPSIALPGPTFVT
ncbi:transposase-like protein [Paraburkholderia sp. UCT70]